jgi:hypothetical protein
LRGKDTTFFVTKQIIALYLEKTICLGGLCKHFSGATLSDALFLFLWHFSTLKARNALKSSFLLYMGFSAGVFSVTKQRKYKFSTGDC